MKSKKKLTDEEKYSAYQEIIPIVQEFRQKEMPKCQRVENTLGLLEEQLGYFVLKFPSAEDKLSGFHIMKSGYHCIYINSAHVLGRQNFSLWHECYHAYANQVSISMEGEAKNDINEYKADCFASCILMPEVLIREYVAEKGINIAYAKYDQLIQMQHFFGVSYSAMITRMIQLFPEHKEDLNVRYALSRKHRHQEFLEKTKRLGLDTALIEPTNEVYFSPRFFEDVKFNLSEGRITQDKCSMLIEMVERLGNHHGQ
ncbi:ImmA/IrrE family metallo-endopeptidase [Pelosinus sp. IPA-1]|uniref:ImmA/IrrE family metallo-endopeptidase n=1 Tax=Pelosinus sp. IPA-1 TaxID=3029569 RepID=UPI0024362406|nr:ImmA/IrrE family metallo-endopeptidase [Pelosinus sp. IPA-1]GMB00095.1 hypothetical protein PIPA1_28940 [Pelosinus sp. IPA-1]